MKVSKFTSTSVEQTRLLGAKFARELSAGMVIGISGELGAGKTEFIRGVCQALGVQDEVSSPTFVLEHEYLVMDKLSQISVIHHWDLYRLGPDSAEIDLWDDVGREEVVSLIEWPERVTAIKELLDVQVTILIVEDGANRVIELARCR